MNPRCKREYKKIILMAAQLDLPENRRDAGVAGSPPVGLDPWLWQRSRCFPPRPHLHSCEYRSRARQGDPGLLIATALSFCPSFSLVAARLCTYFSHVCPASRSHPHEAHCASPSAQNGHRLCCKDRGKTDLVRPVRRTSPRWQPADQGTGASQGHGSASPVQVVCCPGRQAAMAAAVLPDSLVGHGYFLVAYPVPSTNIHGCFPTSSALCAIWGRQLARNSKHACSIHETCESAQHLAIAPKGGRAPASITSGTGQMHLVELQVLALGGLSARLARAPPAC